jgi:hypothetical protein
MIQGTISENDMSPEISFEKSLFWESVLEIGFSKNQSLKNRSFSKQLPENRVTANFSGAPGPNRISRLTERVIVPVRIGVS